MLAVIATILSGLSGCNTGGGSRNHFSWSTSQKLFDTTQGDFAFLDIGSEKEVYGMFFDTFADTFTILQRKSQWSMEKIVNVAVEKDASYRGLLVSADDKLYLFGYNRGIVYRTSEDGGKTWSGDIQPGVDMTTMDIEDISPLIVNGSLYIFGSAMERPISIIKDRDEKKMPEQSIHLSILLLYENEDATWKKSEIFSRNVRVEGPSLSKSRGCWYRNVFHVVWMGSNPIPGAWETHKAVFYSRSEDRGLTWSSPLVLADQISGDSDDLVNISANETGLHVCWADYRHRKMHWLDFRWPFPSDIREENYEIYYRRSLDKGKTWEKDVKISEGISHSYYPSMAVEGSHIAIVWTGNKRPRRKYFYRMHPTDLWIRESFDGGKTWGSISKVENCAKEGYSIHKPVIVLQNGKRHLLYIKGKHTIQEGPGLHLLREPPYEVLYRESVEK